MLDAKRLPRVKVCGLARAEDVTCAIEAGAEALGFVLHPSSPRAVNASQARQLAQAIPASIPTVAVVVHITPDEALAMLEESGLRALQLCGEQRPEDWRDFPFPILRRIPVDNSGAHELIMWESIATGFVLDHPSSAGGSGQQVDLQLAHELGQRAACLLAGGLDGANVAHAIQHARPQGVDASSRLELSPGAKDPMAIQTFTRNAHAAFAELDS